MLEQWKDQEFVSKLIPRYRDVEEPSLDLTPAETFGMLVQCNKANLAIIPQEDFQELLAAWTTLQNPQVKQALAEMGQGSSEGAVVKRR